MILNPIRAFVFLSLVFSATFSVLAQTTYRDVSLDCGGWFSGFSQHSSGRLYGYGDIFGLYRSDDFGVSWTFLQASLTESETAVTGVTVHPADANRVAFISYGTAWTSTNGGTNWTKRLGDLNVGANTRGSMPLLYHPTQTDQLWLASPRNGQSGTLWRSNDNGSNWATVGGSAFTNEKAQTIHFFPANPSEIWVGTRAITGSSTTGGLWCSTDGGSTWTKVWNNGGAQTVNYGAPQVNSIARNSARVSVFATNTGVWRVTSSNWNNASTYAVSQATFANQFIPNVTTLANDTFWCSEIGDQTWAPQVSTDGINWSNRQITLSNTYVPEWTTASQIASSNRVYGRDMMVQDVNNANRWLLTGGASPHLSEDNGLTWSYQPGGIPGIAGWRVTFDRTNPLRAYLATSDQGIFVVGDGGLTGKTIHCSNKAFNELHSFHEAMVSATGQTIVGAGVDQSNNRTVIIRSTDGGVNWAKITSTGLPDSYEGITRSVMSLNDPNDFLVILGATDKVGQANNPGIYRTTNGGSNFSKVGGTTFDGVDTGMRYHDEEAYLERDGVNASVRYLYLRAQNNSSVRGVWRSTDGGSNWTKRVDPFGGQWGNAFSVDPTIEGRLWVGGNKLRRSDDGGGTWSDVSNFTHVLALDSYDGRLAVTGRQSGDSYQKVYSSLDHGQSWLEVSSSQNTLVWTNNISVDTWRSGQIWLSGSRSFQLINPPSALNPELPGSASGSAPSGGNSANNAGKAYDSDTATFFAPAANGGLTQLDLGGTTTAQVTAIRYFPRAGFEGRMNGSRFEGSPNGTTWTTLLSLTSTPSSGWQTALVTDTNSYRYMRYIHPTGLADVAEIKFHGLINTTPLLLNQPLAPLSSLVGQAVTYPLAASGFPRPTFSITNGALPAGLTLNAATGLISGTPTTTALNSMTIQATNVQGSSNATLTLNIRLGPQLQVAAPAPTYNQPMNSIATAPVILTNTGDAPLSWSASVPTVNGNYAVTESTTAGSGVVYNWIDAVTAGTKINFSDPDDSNSGSIALPFSFPFYGTNRNSVNVCTNGWVSFTSTSTSYVAPASFPNTSSPTSILAPFYADLYLRPDSAVYYRTIDSQTFVISYVDLVRYADNSANNPQRYTFQIILKSDGTVFFQYQKFPDLAIGSNTGIGLQNESRTLGSSIPKPLPISNLVQRAYKLSPSLGWLTALSPNSSSTAGGTLAAGASITLNATVNTNGIANGQTRSADLTFTSNDPLYPTRIIPINLSVTAFTGLISFRSTHGLAANGSQDTSTPAGDGVANLQKYAFNMIGVGAGQSSTLNTPNVNTVAASGSAGLPLVGVGTGGDAGKLQITFVRRKAASNSGINYSVEFSDTLAAGSWAANGLATTSTAVSIDTDYERVTVTDSVVQPKRFVRVKVTTP